MPSQQIRWGCLFGWVFGLFFGATIGGLVSVGAFLLFGAPATERAPVLYFLLGMIVGMPLGVWLMHRAVMRERPMLVVPVTSALVGAAIAAFLWTTMDPSAGTAWAIALPALGAFAGFLAVAAVWKDYRRRHPAVGAGAIVGLSCGVPVFLLGFAIGSSIRGAKGGAGLGLGALFGGAAALIGFVAGCLLSAWSARAP